MWAAAIAWLMAGASIGVGLAAWLWSQWVAQRWALPSAVTLGAIVVVVGLALAFASPLWVAVAAGLVLGCASALVRIRMRSRLRSLHLAALPVTPSDRWRVALGDVLHTPSGDPRAAAVDIGLRSVAPTGQRVVLPPAPCRFRGLGGWYLGLGLDPERSAWAAQLADRVLGDLGSLSEPLVLLSDEQVAVLAVCRTLALDVETIVLHRPLDAMEGPVRRRMEELLEEEAGRRTVVMR